MVSHDSFLNDLLNYIRQSINKEQAAEIIRFWAEDYHYNLALKEIHINIENIELQHLENLKHESYVRVIFE